MKKEAEPHLALPAVDAAAAPAQADDAPSPASGKSENRDAGEVASSDGDGGFPLAPLPVVASAPPAKAAEAPAPTKSTGATGMAVFGAALAAIGLIVLALARRGR